MQMLRNYKISDDRSLHATVVWYEGDYPTIRSVGLDTEFTVFHFLVCMYSYGFLSRGFTNRRAILNGGSA